MNIDYTNTASELVNRIRSLIPEHPEIMTMTSVWDLFQLPGLVCTDLGLTMHQAMWALTMARKLGPPEKA